jgi:hypothetical protein
MMFGDKFKISILEKTMVAFQIKKNTIHTIFDFFFVTELKINLFSTNQFKNRDMEFIYIKK